MAQVNQYSELVMIAVLTICTQEFVVTEHFNFAVLCAKRVIIFDM